MDDVMLSYSTSVQDGRVCAEIEAGWVVADCQWLLTHGCLFRMH